MIKEHLKIDKWDAIVITSDDWVCISFDGEGGAIITKNSFKEAKSEFIKMMTLCESIQKLLNFKTYGKF
jgi:hypothetical protein